MLNLKFFSLNPTL